MSVNEDRVRAAYWLAFSETIDDEEDKRLLAAENRAHEAAMEAGFPDDFDAAKRVALAVLAVADFAVAGVRVDDPPTDVEAVAKEISKEFGSVACSPPVREPEQSDEEVERAVTGASKPG